MPWGSGGGTWPGTPPGGGGPGPPPPGGGTQVGQQKEYSLHGGRYASCVHAGGLSCLYLFSAKSIYHVLGEVVGANVKVPCPTGRGKFIQHGRSRRGHVLSKLSHIKINLLNLNRFLNVGLMVLASLFKCEICLLKSHENLKEWTVRWYLMIIIIYARSSTWTGW